MDFGKWAREMRVWSAASHFNTVESAVQAAFAGKHTEIEFDEKIKDKALRDGVDLHFENYMQLASTIFREQPSIFLWRVEFFQLKPKDSSAKGLLTYI